MNVIKTKMNEISKNIEEKGKDFIIDDIFKYYGLYRK